MPHFSDSSGTKYSKMEIYQPAEDSYFFQDFLKKYLSTSTSSTTILEIGTASGILSETAPKFIDKKNITPVDINPKSIKLLKQKGFKAIKSNLFEKIKNKYDLIIFNAPYLPLDKREPKDSQITTTGGKRGDEISVKFLKQAKKHLNKNGKILLLISSLTPMDKIKKFNPKIVAKKKLFMEELQILQFKN